jgi:hypothetical protein
MRLRVQHQRDLAAEPSRHHDMGLRRRFEPALPVLISGRSMANSEVARPKRVGGALGGRLTQKFCKRIK